MIARLCHIVLLAATLIVASACGGQAGPSITTDQLRPLRTISGPDSAEGTDSLEARMTSIREQMESAGLTRGGIWERGFVPGGGRETLRLEIPADTCATIVALASSGVRDVDAVLYLPDGTQVAQDGQPDSHPTLQVCADGVGRYFYYALHAYDGAGAYLVASFLSDRSLFARAAAIVGGRPGVAGEVELSPEERVVQVFSENVQRRGFAATKAPVRLMLAASQSVRAAVDVEVAHCYTVAAFALDGLEDLNVRVLDEQGREVAFDTSGSRDASTQFCADRAVQFNAELIAARGQGGAVLAIYSTPQAALGGNSGLWLGERTDEQLSQRPLQDALRADAIAAVEAGYSEPSVRARGRLVIGEAAEHQLHLKPATCSRIAASGGEGSGVLRVEVADVTLAPEAERRRERAAQRLPQTMPGLRFGGLGLKPTPRRIDDSQLEVCAEGNDPMDARVIVISRRGFGDYAISVATKALTER